MIEYYSIISNFINAILYIMTFLNHLILKIKLICRYFYSVSKLFILAKNMNTMINYDNDNNKFTLMILKSLEFYRFVWN